MPTKHDIEESTNGWVVVNADTGKLIIFTKEQAYMIARLLDRQRLLPHLRHADSRTGITKLKT